jgi:hypothetical protein
MVMEALPHATLIAAAQTLDEFRQLGQALTTMLALVAGDGKVPTSTSYDAADGFGVERDALTRRATLRSV